MIINSHVKDFKDFHRTLKRLFSHAFKICFNQSVHYVLNVAVNNQTPNPAFKKCAYKNQLEK